MRTGIFLVQSGPADPAQGDAFNDWYSGTHIPEVLSIPGFVGAARYRVVGESAPQEAYLAAYEIEADELAEPLQELNRRMRAGEMTMPTGVTFDRAPVTTLYERIP